MLQNAQNPILDALGNAERRGLLLLLNEGPQSVGDIASSLPISRPAVSRHLRLLKEAGLVRDRAQGTRRLYALEPAGFAAAAQWLNSFWDEAGARLKLAAENLPEATRD
jgi:DNA-binding transcriptional ArsR family regulator